MRQSNTTLRTPSGRACDGYQPLGKGHQPARALSTTPPRGGSGVPASARPTPVTAPSTPAVASAPPALPSGSQQGSRG